MYYETRKLLYWGIGTLGVGFSTVAAAVDSGSLGVLAWLPALVGIGAAALDAHQHRKTGDAPKDVVVSES